MLEMIALVGLFVAGLAVVAVVGVVFPYQGPVLDRIFLPFRLLLKLLLIPLGSPWARSASPPGPRSCRSS